MPIFNYLNTPGPTSRVFIFEILWKAYTRSISRQNVEKEREPYPNVFFFSLLSVWLDKHYSCRYPLSSFNDNLCILDSPWNFPCVRDSSKNFIVPFHGAKWFSNCRFTFHPWCWFLVNVKATALSHSFTAGMSSNVEFCLFWMIALWCVKGIERNAAFLFA